MNDADVPQEFLWPETEFLEHFCNLNDTMETRNFCFFLGSGASKPSGIPTGGELAWRWMTELYQRKHAGQKPENDEALQAWATAETLGIPGFDPDNPARSYSQLYRARFGKDDEQAYDYLEKVMDNPTPSFGYSVLAQLIDDTRHKVVLTTNFDNLVADALLLYTGLTPLVCGHESLASFARAKTTLRRPVIAKVHRDLFFAPLNADDQVAELSEPWAKALRNLLRDFCPVFIGYGGNDPSVMDFLATLEPGEIEGGVFWVYRRGSDPPYPPEASELVNKHGGALVGSSGFDEFMFLLHQKMGYGYLDDHVKTVAEERADTYNRQRKALFDQINQADPSERTPEKQAVQELSDKPESWWQWLLRAESAPDDDAREQVYREGIAALPDSAELIGGFAYFMARTRGDHDEAERLYRRALELDPKDASNTGNFAVFMKNMRGNHDEAERLYRRALELDPKDASNTGNFAVFMTDMRGDHDEAERLYRRALELDPKHASHTGNLANLMADIRSDHDEAERLYRRALELDPKNANHATNYAGFLLARARWDEAERQAKAAWALSQPVAKPKQTIGELLVYGRLLDAIAHRDGATTEGRLKTLLGENIVRVPWSFDAQFAAIGNEVSPDELDYLRRIADAVVDADKLPDLSADPRWDQVTPVPLEGPWRP